MDIIQAEKLSYDYVSVDDDGNEKDRYRAVDGVDLRVEKGDFIAILGHNGSGKSTLAKHINALLQPTEGTLLVDGMDTRSEDQVWKIRQSAGMVFQIRIIRSSERSLMKMLRSDRKILVWKKMRSGGE